MLLVWVALVTGVERCVLCCAVGWSSCNLVSVMPLTVTLLSTWGLVLKQCADLCQDHLSLTWIRPCQHKQDVSLEGLTAVQLKIPLTLSHGLIGPDVMSEGLSDIWLLETSVHVVSECWDPCTVTPYDEIMRLFWVLSVCLYASS
jgi:hypothetical protein